MPPYGNFSFENTAWDEVADYTDHLVVTVTRQGGLSAMARTHQRDVKRGHKAGC